MATTLELVISLPDPLHELLIAELSEMGAEGFVQEDDVLRVYLPASNWGDVERETVQRWLITYDQPPQIVEQVVPPQNWNARWEAGIRPISIGRFLIKPTWTETPPEDAHREIILIDPKMSFGTGHHETTRLMIELMERYPRPGGRILDAGAGTGILTIAALRLGAATAVAFDIDPWAEANAQENFALNGVAEQVDFRIGSLEVVPENGFDWMLANIQRHVIVPMLPSFVQKLVPGGFVVLSGILRSDIERVLEAAEAVGLILIGEAVEAEWWAGCLGA